MNFEFDPDKSDQNKLKHGIDFTEAQKLWRDSEAIELYAKSETEPRLALIAKLNDKLWVAFFTIRNKNIRLISVRRARLKEKEYYES